MKKSVSKAAGLFFSALIAVTPVLAAASQKVSVELSPADLTGHWVGKGKSTSTFGVNADCSSIDIEITQTQTEFIIQKYRALCGIQDSDWGPNHMQIKGADVYENGEIVGHIDENGIETASPDSGVLYVFNLKKITNVDGSTSVQAKYSTQNAIGSFSIDGALDKK